VSEAAQLVRYDAMCHAIAAAHAVDEVKDIRDKAQALEHYARQARNTEAERQACEIRLRAERRCGQLTTEMITAPGRRSDLTSPQHAERLTKAEQLAGAGISTDQAERWERVAAIPAEQFETDIADPGWRPTTSGLIERQEARERGPLPQQTVDDDALWLWGALQEFQRRGVLERDPDEVTETMLGHMRATTDELAPRVACWLQCINGG
jgi:hypothetical protein